MDALNILALGLAAKGGGGGGTTYTAGDNIDITNDEISVTSEINLEDGDHSSTLGGSDLAFAYESTEGGITEVNDTHYSSNSIGMSVGTIEQEVPVSYSELMIHPNEITMSDYKDEEESYIALTTEDDKLLVNGTPVALEYTAGDNINITNNEISVTSEIDLEDGNYTAALDGVGLGLTFEDSQEDEDQHVHTEINETNYKSMGANIMVGELVDSVPAYYQNLELNPDSIAIEVYEGREGYEEINSRIELTTDDNKLLVNGSAVALESDIPAAELPTITSSDAGKILKVNSNHDGVEWGSESTELPTITGNANKVLKVNSGATAVEWANEATELPTISTGDAGKVLTVNSLETGVEWAAGGGGGSYTFTNGLTESSGTVSWDLYNAKTLKGTGENSLISYSGGQYGMNAVASAKAALIRGDYGNYKNLTASGRGSMILASDTGNSGNLTSSGIGSLIIGSMFQSISNAEVKSSGSGSIVLGTNYNNNNNTEPSMIASGEGSIAGGYYYGFNQYDEPIKSTGNASIAYGSGVQALSNNQTVLGKYNVTDNANTYAFIIGNGANSSGTVTKSNALTVDWNGNLVCNNIPAPPAGDGTYNLQCTVSSGVATYTWVAAQS